MTLHLLNHYKNIRLHFYSVEFQIYILDQLILIQYNVQDGDFFVFTISPPCSAHLIYNIYINGRKFTFKNPPSEIKLWPIDCEFK